MPYYNLPAATYINGSLPFVNAADTQFGLVGDGTTDDAVALQAMFDANGAAAYYFRADKTYTTSVPLKIDQGAWIIGAGTNRKSVAAGTTFRVKSGSSSVLWAGKGIFNTRNYTDNTTYTATGEVVGFKDLLLDGNNLTYGSGIVVAGCAQPMFINLRIENFKGTVAMASRGPGVTKSSSAAGGTGGQGFGICHTTYTANGGDAMAANNPGNSYWLFCRSTTNNVAIWTDDGARNDSGNSTITDGILYFYQPEAQYTVQAIGSQGMIDINHAGAWHLDFLHMNGTGGDAVVLKNCMATHVRNSWLDGWGTAVGGGSHYMLNCTSTGGGNAGNSSMNIEGNTFRWRDEQTSPDTYYAVKYAASGQTAALNFNGNNGFIQSNLATGTHKLFDLAAGNGQIVLHHNANTFHEAGGTNPTATASAGALTGTYYYAVTLVGNGGETPLSTTTASAASSTGNPTQAKGDIGVGITLAAGTGPALTNIPTGSASSGVTARRIYRTAANPGASPGTTAFKLLTTINDNTTTSMTSDAVPDGSLGAAWPVSPPMTFADDKIYNNPSGTGITVRGETNCWNYGTAAPVGGAWPLAAKRWSTAPAIGSTLEWVCTTAGSPGTWAQHTLDQVSFGYLNNQTTTSATTMANVGLSFPIGANEVWEYDYRIVALSGSTGSGMKFQLTGPASPTYVQMGLSGLGASSTGFKTQSVTAFSTSSGAFGAGVGVQGVITISGNIENGTTAGTVALQWEAVASTETNTISRGSWLCARRVA